MDSELFIGIVAGLLIAYVVTRISRSRAKPGKNERPQYIDVRKKFYFDDKTRVYIFILAVILILLVLTYAFRFDTPTNYQK